MGTLSVGRAFGALLLVFLAAAGCNALFGVDDPVVEPTTDGSAGSGGGADSGSGGAAGGSGGGGTAGTGGLGGSSGSDASTAGASGSAGADAGGDAPGDASCSENLSSDPDHCGVCGHSCLGADCANGLCVPQKLSDINRGVESLVAVPGGILAAYWNPQFSRFDFGTSQLTKWTVGGANAMLNVFGGQAYFMNVYLGDIFKAPTDGSAPPTLHLDLPNTVEAFAVDASGLYYVDHVSSQNTKLYRANLDGSNAAEVATGVVRPEVLRTDDDALYLHGTYGSQVQRVGKPGKPDAGAVTVLSASGEGYGLALDDEYVYFTSHQQTTGQLRRVKKDGSGEQLLIGNQKFPMAVLRVGEYVYWGSSGSPPTLTDGTVQRAKLGPGGIGAPEVIATQQDNPAVLAADTTHVYWATIGPAPPSPLLGSLWRVAR